jgi:hypothetical protein
MTEPKKYYREVIVHNKVKCLKCGDVIESKSVHDFKYCTCGNVAVDGGHDYLRRCFKDDVNTWADLSETYQEERIPSEWELEYDNKRKDLGDT